MEKKYLLLRILVLFFTGVLFSACQKEGLIAPQNDALEEEIMAGALRAGLHDSSLPVNPYFELDSIGKPTQIFRETVNSTTLKNTMKTKHQPTRILPTGYYLAPNQSITVNVQLQSGSTLPKLQIGTHSRYHDYSYNPPIYNLTTGANTITANSDGGIAWIIYEQPQGTSGTPVSEARVTFGGSIARIPVFIKKQNHPDVLAKSAQFIQRH